MMMKNNGAGKGRRKSPFLTRSFFVSAFLHRLVDDAADGVRRLPLHPLGDVGIGVQRKPCAVVPQGIREGFHIYAVLQRQGCEGMP